MKLNLTYGASFELIITTVDGNFTHEMKSCTLQDAVDYAEMIFDNKTPLRGETVSKVTICDTYTGEICAECEHDPVENNMISENEDYTISWPEPWPENYFPDWD